MSSVTAGSPGVSVSSDPLSRPLALGLSGEGPQRALQGSGFGGYSPSPSGPEWGPPVLSSSSPSHSSLGYSGSVLSPYSSQFYPGLSNTSLLYPREGTEV
ncbi:hypothetical protein GJAV_G00195950 [Gymnothorax javanicus]|nr:hypothetical protein GJAV_G00195950 [Gymnothorax javanicus]